MATVLQQFDSQQDEQDNKSSGQGSNPNISAPEAPTVGGTQGGGVVTPGSSGSGSTGTSSGRFNNIQKYLNANKDFNSAQGGLAGQIVGNVNSQAQGLKSNIQGASNAFQQQSQAATTPFTNPDLVNQAFQNPDAFVQNQDQLNQFNAVRDANYAGPKSLQDLSGDQNLANLQNRSSQIADTINQGQSESGRFNLLKTMYGNPNYTTGQQNLDNLLLQNDQGQLKQLQGVRQVSSDINRNLNSAEANAQGQATAAQNQANQVSTDLRSKLNDTTNQTLTADQAKYNQAVQQQNDYYTTLVNQLNDTSPHIDPATGQPIAGYAPEDLSKLTNVNGTPGINLDLSYVKALQQIGVQPGSFVSQNAAPSAQNVLSSSDYSRLNALNTLMGGSNGAIAALANPTVSASLGQYLGNEGQAGTYDPNKLATFDSDRYNSAIGQARAAYQEAVSPTVDQITSQFNQLNKLEPTIQQALKDAQEAYKGTSTVNQINGTPTLSKPEDILNWYYNTVQQPEFQQAQWHPAIYAPPQYNASDLVNQAHQLADQYENTKTKLGQINSQYGNVFGNDLQAMGGQNLNAVDPLEFLYNNLGTPVGIPQALPRANPAVNSALPQPNLGRQI